MPFRCLLSLLYTNYYLIVCNSKFILFSCSLRGGSDEACLDVSLAKVLSFCIGSEYPPPLSFTNPITVCFDSNTDWPLASTCTTQLTLPTKFYNVTLLRVSFRL